MERLWRLPHRRLAEGRAVCARPAGPDRRALKLELELELEPDGAASARQLAHSARKSSEPPEVEGHSTRANICARRSLPAPDD